MGNCMTAEKSGGVNGTKGVKPVMYTALYDHNAPGRLRFRKGDTLIVIGSEDRFTFVGHVQGGRITGTIPATYVKRTDGGTAPPPPVTAAAQRRSNKRRSSISTWDVTRRRSSNTSNTSAGRQGDARRRSSTTVTHPPMNLVKVQGRTRVSTAWGTPDKAAPSLVVVKSRASSGSDALPLGSRPTAAHGQHANGPLAPILKKSPSAPTAVTNRHASNHVRFARHNPPVGETYHAFDYERGGEFDAERSQRAWELEEAAESRRMLEFRWYIMERDLPPGTRCAERTAHEDAARLKAEQESRAREERRAKILAMRAAKRRQEAATVTDTDALPPVHTTSSTLSSTYSGGRHAHGHTTARGTTPVATRQEHYPAVPNLHLQKVGSRPATAYAFDPEEDELDC
eukprot:m.196450 g.196450  ORF g.196450 m.196450 type:complete len:399 (+) comp19809_c0_seq1:256-1452(+)